MRDTGLQVVGNVKIYLNAIVCAGVHLIPPNHNRIHERLVKEQ